MGHTGVDFERIRIKFMKALVMRIRQGKKYSQNLFFFCILHAVTLIVWYKKKFQALSATLNWLINIYNLLLKQETNWSE